MNLVSGQKEDFYINGEKQAVRRWLTLSGDGKLVCQLANLAKS